MGEKNNIVTVFLFFFRIMPYNLLASICTTLFAQFFLILSYFLPIKVIILLNMEQLPSYLTSAFKGYDKNEIILFLTFLIFIFYAISILVDRYSEFLILDGMAKILNQKKVDITPSNKLIYKFTHSFFKFIATFFLLFSMYIVLIFIFPTVALFLLFCIIIIITIYIYILKHDTTSYNTYFKITTGIGFMMVFIYEVVDILYLKTQEVTLLIILLSVVLTRYIFTRGHYMINQLVFVQSNIKNFKKRVIRCAS